MEITWRWLFSFSVFSWGNNFPRYYVWNGDDIYLLEVAHFVLIADGAFTWARPLDLCLVIEIRTWRVSIQPPYHLLGAMIRPIKVQ